jgi:ATP-dependent helicase/nuclease subunit B
MPAEVAVLIGPARSGRTHRLVTNYRAALNDARTQVGRALWLAPSSRGVASVRAQLLAGTATAFLDPAILTFDHLADRVLAALPATPKVLSPVQQRRSLRHIVGRLRDNKQLALYEAASQRDSFVELLVDMIDELTRHDITAATFAKSIGTRGERIQHAELSTIFTEYSVLLSKHHLCDAEGRLAVVRDALRSKDLPLFENLRLVVADGFTDFTCLQLEILAALAQRSHRLLVSLPGDESLSKSADKHASGRADSLFAKSAATLAELRHLNPQLQVDLVRDRPSAWPAIDYFAKNIFLPPRAVAKPSQAVLDSLDRAEIIAAAGTHDEVIQIARRIKNQLATGAARPSDLVVVFRSLHDAAPRVREVFDQYGIPYALESGAPLISIGSVRLVADLLRLDHEDWPFRGLVAVVTNNLLAAFDRPARTACEWLIRQLQIADGREVLLNRVEQLAANQLSEVPDDAQSTPSDHRRDRASVAVSSLALLRQLAEALDELPTSATPAEWISAFDKLRARLEVSLLNSTDGETDAQDSRSDWYEDRLAWQSIARNFAAVAELATTLGEAPQLTRAEASRLLVDITARESLPRPYDDAGRVRVLAAATARNVEAKHLFLAGMSEQSFPSPERVGRLYAESDYQCFQNVGDQRRAAAPPPKVERSQEEMLLFYEVLTRATERLTISYPALDDKAQDLPPSSYVTELERLLADHVKIKRVEPQISPPHSEQLPLSPAEWRIQAIQRAIGKEQERDLTLLAGLIRNEGTKAVATSIDAALRLYALRTNRDAFGPADGLLTSPAIRAQLARRFGPQHLWSPSQWETFASCPFKSLLGDVLKLEPLGELTLETDPLRRGSRLHRVMAAVHRDLRTSDDPATTFSQRDSAVVAAAFARALSAELGESTRPGLDGALDLLDRRQIDQWSRQYLADHAKYDAAWQKPERKLKQPPLPAFFEFRFGPPRSERRDDEDPHSTDEPFRLQLGNEEIRVTGRIDRVDVGKDGEGRTIFNVVDYKTGKRPSLTTDKMESGERLQPPLYVMAAQVLLFGADNAHPLWAGYWSMASGVTTRADYSLCCSSDDGKPSESWLALQNSLVEVIKRLVTDMRAGNFPVASRDEHCTSYCDFATVCRVAQVRSLDKQWLPVDSQL